MWFPDLQVVNPERLSGRYCLFFVSNFLALVAFAAGTFFPEAVSAFFAVAAVF